MVLLAAAMLTSVAAQSSATLRYKFKPGESFRYELSVGRTMSMPKSKTPAIFSMDTVTGYVVGALNKDSSAHIVTTIEKATGVGVVSSMSRTIEGKKTSFNMSPTGKVANLHVDVAGLRGSDLNTDSAQMLILLPMTPVHVGSSWQTVFSAPSIGNVTLRNTLTGLSSGMAHIHATGHLDIGAGVSKSVHIGVHSTGNMDVSIDYVFNVAKGVMQSMNGGAKLAFGTGGGAARAAQSPKMTGTQTYKLRLLM